MQDVIEIVKKGSIKMEAEKDLVTGEWKYRIEGKNIDGDVIAVIVSIVDDKTSKYITVFEV